MKKSLSLLAFIFWWSLSPTLYGQDDLKFEHLTTLNGLSSNLVYSICQDREGFIWIGTLDGLNRYDGYTFKTFRADPRDPDHTLQHNIITVIHEDRAGRLWVGTMGGGLHEVDKRTGDITPYRIDPKHVNLWNVISFIHEDHQGMLWLGAGKGIARFDPETKQYKLYPSPSEEAVFSIFDNSSGKFWTSNYQNVLRFDPNTGEYTTYSFPYPNSFWMLPFHLTSGGQAWIGTGGSGLFQMDINKPGLFTPYQPKVGTVNKYIYSFYESGGYLWVGTTEGLQRINPRTAEVVTYQASTELPNRLSGNIVQAMYRDRAGTLWVGTTNGLNRVITQAKQFHAYQLFPSLPGIRRKENNIRTILEDHTGTLWVGSSNNVLFGYSQNGLFRYDAQRSEATHIPADSANPKALLSNDVLSIHEDRNRQLWIGTRKALHRYNRATRTFTRYRSTVSCESITEDPSGILWMSGQPFSNGQPAGIASFDPQTGKFVNYLSNPKNQNGLTDNNIVGVFASRTGLIYVATGGDGVNRLDPKTGKFTRYLPDYVTPEGHLNDK